MDEAAKKKYCHLLMFDISEPGQEMSSNNNKSDHDDCKPCYNGSSQKTSTAATTVAPASLTTKSTKQRKPRARKPKRTPRPPNAFILYRKAKQPDVVAQNKNLTNAEVSKVISKMWWKENEEERFQWEKRADRMKLKHMQDYPDYVYQPKKPGTKKRKSTQRSDKSAGTISSISPIQVEKNSSALPDETITAIAEVAFAVGNKPNHSQSPTTLPSPPSSVDRSPTISSNQSNQPPMISHGILHHHHHHRLSSSINHMTFPHYAVYSHHPPTPTEVYDITPQFLLPPSDTYISHGHLITSQQCFNPIEATTYISPHALTSNNLDSFLDAQPVDKFPYFISQDTSATPSVYFDTNYASEFFHNNTTPSSSPTIIEDMETYFDETQPQTSCSQYSNKRCSF